VLLVGVYDLEADVARISVPICGDQAETQLPTDWPKWHGDENLQLGHAWFRDAFVDWWPGSIRPVWAYAGVLDEAEAASLRDRGMLAGRWARGCACPEVSWVSDVGVLRCQASRS
jgi:hypothetical protein